MSPTFIEMSHEQVELIDGELLTVTEVARLCKVSEAWVQTHLEAEVIVGAWQDGVCYFNAATLLRARQIAEIEAQFEADPQLAGLVTDLIDEVRTLRRQLKAR